MQNHLGRLGGQLGVALCLIGFVVIFFGWNGAASNNNVTAQFPYLISGGIAGLAIVTIGTSMLVVQNQRADRARLEAALDRLAAAVARQGGAHGAGAGSLGPHGYVIAGATSYHKLDCALTEARDEAQVVPLEDLVNSELEPCRVCRPPQFRRLATPN